MCADYNQKLKQRMLDKFGDIITKLKEVIKPINENSSETLADIIYLSQLKLFHVFVINEKQTVLVVDTQNRIFELTCKIGIVSKSSTKSKKELKESFVKRLIPGNEVIKDICCGESHTLVLTQSGKVYAWGNNYYGQLGNNSYKNSEQPDYVNIAVNNGDFIKKVCCGYYHNLALSENGLLYAWGRNDDRQCWDIKQSKINEPMKVLESTANINDISCGAYHSIALDPNGNVYTWGRNDFGQLGILHNLTDKSCHKVNSKKVKKIVSGYSHNLLLTRDGEIYAFGSNKFKQISDANQANFNKPTLIDFGKSVGYQDIAASLSLPVSLASVKSISNLDEECCAIGFGVSDTNKNTNISMQEWFIEYMNCTYKPIILHCLADTLEDKTNRFERIDACFWSAANNILENYEFEKIENQTQQQIDKKEKQFSEIKNLFTNLMQVNKQIPFDSSDKREFAKLNIYHTLNANLWQIYEFKPKRFSTEFYDHKKLGNGGYGTVYRASCSKKYDPNNSNHSSDDNGLEWVAIKRIAITEYDVKKSLREIELSKSLNSNFVVSVKSFWLEYNDLIKKSGEFNEEFAKSIESSREEYNLLIAKNSFIVLNIESELCGPSLEEILAKLESNKETAVRKTLLANIFMLPLGYYIASELVLEILSAVDYLHRHRLTHRDLKPQNILIKDFEDYDGIQRFVKIGDFGLAVFQTKDNQTLSTRNVKGTKDYIPPEVLTKASDAEATEKDWRKIEKDMDIHNTVSQKWDLFSIGQIFKDMFFIQNITSDEDYKEKSVTIDNSLQEKYKKLFDETNLLKSVTADKRPKCIDLLKKERHSKFLMDKNECLGLCNDEDISKYKPPFDKELELTDDSFIEFFMRKKLK